MVFEIGRHVFAVFRQGNPCLDAEQAVAGAAGIVAGAFRMRHAAPRQHPVHLTGIDHLVGAQTVAVLKFALVQVGHSPQPDMRVRAHVDALIGQKLGRSHLVEKDEGPDHLATRCRKRTPDLEPADVAGTGDDHRVDAVGVDRVRVDGGVPAHVTLLWLRLG